jgi:hypothetical protein
VEHHDIVRLLLVIIGLIMLRLIGWLQLITITHIRANFVLKLRVIAQRFVDLSQ